MISSIAELQEGVAQLAAREARFALVAQQGLPPLRRKEQGFATLAEILIEQMISLEAAAAIIRRFQSEFGSLEALNVAQAQPSRLRALGLSGAKAEALKSMAQAVAERRFDLEVLASMEDEDAASLLMGLKGIGPWSAHIYLLTALGRSDAWPAGDVALATAVKSLFDFESRPDAKTLGEIAEAWRPWRSVAARLLWMHYRKGKKYELVKANSLAPFTASLHKI
jgi:DNA-3-methyladenine glycosylase II